MRNAYRTLVVRQLTTTRPRWEDNIKMDLNGKIWGSMSWNCSG